MRTAKALQKIKHIKQIKSSIKYHEAARAKKAPIFQERFEGTQARLRKEKYDAKWIKGDIKIARRNYREDWALGPLRPNRAVGENAELYGALDKDQLRFPEIPIATQRMKNKLREKAGLDPEWPIVVEDKRLYPIVKNDRVVVIRGKEMNKIGIVENISEDSHMVELKDVNKAYVDSSIFALSGSPEEKPKREFNFPFNVNDLRLVVPMSVTEIHDGRPVKVQQDVIVDKVVLEKYTRGLNPYTGERSHNNVILPEHRINPKTNEPVYHRYIAGTRHVIDWPLDKSVAEIAPPEAEAEAKAEPEESQGIAATVRNFTSKIFNPRSRRRQQTLESGLFSKSKKEEAVETPIEVEAESLDQYREREPLYTPKEIERKSLRYNIEETSSENVINPAALTSPRSKDQTPAKFRKDKPISKKLKVKTKPRITKTPQQVIWDYEARQRRKTTFTHHNQRPKLDVGLLEAIGMHMEKNGVKAVPKKSTEYNEVD